MLKGELKILDGIETDENWIKIEIKTKDLDSRRLKKTKVRIMRLQHTSKDTFHSTSDGADEISEPLNVDK